MLPSLAPTRSLPLRLAEFGSVYRYEQSGELHGLTRARSFTQDDAHIFCTPEQVEAEFVKVIDLVLHIFTVLGFEQYTAQVSLRDEQKKEKYIGKEADWQAAEQCHSISRQGEGFACRAAQRRGCVLRPQAGLHAARRPG